MICLSRVLKPATMWTVYILHMPCNQNFESIDSIVIHKIDSFQRYSFVSLFGKVCSNVGYPSPKHGFIPPACSPPSCSTSVVINLRYKIYLQQFSDFYIRQTFFWLSLNTCSVATIASTSEHDNAP